jgi:hypothetical protein
MEDLTAYIRYVLFMTGVVFTSRRELSFLCVTKSDEMRYHGMGADICDWFLLWPMCSICVATSVYF